MPPYPPNPASDLDMARPPTKMRSVLAPTDRFATPVCPPVAGSKNVAVHVFPPCGTMAARFAFRLLPNSLAARSMIARASGLLKNPVRSRE